MDFSKLANLSVGLAAFLGGLWLVLQIIKLLKQRNGNNHANKAGERSTDEWEGKMRDIARTANEEMMEDIRSLMETRNDKLREIIRQELNNRR
jgi:flagellar biosynthesis/type III secretory pathway M-ring protein FliF/YscJ